MTKLIEQFLRDKINLCNSVLGVYLEVVRLSLNFIILVSKPSFLEFIVFIFCRFVILKMPKKNSSNTSKPGLQNPAIAGWDMPKKSSSKPPKPVLQKLSIPKEKPSSTPGTFGHEIDDIFSKKRKKPEQQKTKKMTGVAGKPTKMDKETGRDSKDDASVTRRKKRNNSGESNVDMFDNEQTARSKRKTADGLAIYKEEELGIGRADAGGTRLCPFDCDCCF